LLDPAASQDLDGGHLTQPYRRIGGEDGLEELVTIPADEIGVRPAFVLALRQPIIIRTRAVAVDPLRSAPDG
jgi:hypothetical protein